MKLSVSVCVCVCMCVCVHVRACMGALLTLVFVGVCVHVPQINFWALLDAACMYVIGMAR